MMAASNLWKHRLRVVREGFFFCFESHFFSILLSSSIPTGYQKGTRPTHTQDHTQHTPHSAPTTHTTQHTRTHTDTQHTHIYKPPQTHMYTIRTQLTTTQDNIHTYTHTHTQTHKHTHSRLRVYLFQWNLRCPELEAYISCSSCSISMHVLEAAFVVASTETAASSSACAPAASTALSALLTLSSVGVFPREALRTEDNDTGVSKPAALVACAWHPSRIPVCARASRCQCCCWLWVCCLCNESYL